MGTLHDGSTFHGIVGEGAMAASLGKPGPDNRTDSEKFGYDAANRPAHYLRHKIEPVLFIVENELPFLEANVVKYILRHKDKNGIEDLRKAARYLEMLIKREQGQEEWNK